MCQIFSCNIERQNEQFTYTLSLKLYIYNFQSSLVNVNTSMVSNNIILFGNFIVETTEI